MDTSPFRPARSSAAAYAPRSMSRLDELNDERARVLHRLREINVARDHGDEWDDEEEIRLSRTLVALEAQIAELGGALEPVPNDDDPAVTVGGGDGDGEGRTAEGDGPSAAAAQAQTYLGLPPETIDALWNKLVEAYEQAQQAVADHAMAHRDDWTCTHDDPRTHAGCAIWWRGEMTNLLAHLRDAADQLLDDLAGPRTQQEFADDKAMLDYAGTSWRRSMPRSTRSTTDSTTAQFDQDEKTYKAVRDAGGDVGPYAGPITAGRHRLLFDIAEKQKELARLRHRHTAILTRLRQLQIAAGSIRRDRGLERAKERWPGLDLDLGGPGDEALLRRLLGDEQYERMREEMRRQATQMRQRRTRRTSRFVPGRTAITLVAALLLIGLVVGAIAWRWSNDDAAVSADTGPVGAVDDPLDDGPLDDPVADGSAGEALDGVDVPQVIDECVLDSELELLGIEVVPGRHHQGNVEFG